MSPERPGGEPPHEQEQELYYRAARFQGEAPARRAYFAAQRTIFETPCELSTYRIILNGLWYVAVTGVKPPEEVEQKLARDLRAGDPVPLPDDIVQALAERGDQERRKGPWIERHYRLNQN